MTILRLENIEFDDVSISNNDNISNRYLSDEENITSNFETEKNIDIINKVKTLTI